MTFKDRRTDEIPRIMSVGRKDEQGLRCGTPMKYRCIGSVCVVYKHMNETHMH